MKEDGHKTEMIQLQDSKSFKKDENGTLNEEQTDNIKTERSNPASDLCDVPSDTKNDEKAIKASNQDSKFFEKYGNAALNEEKTDSVDMERTNSESDSSEVPSDTEIDKKAIKASNKEVTTGFPLERNAKGFSKFRLLWILIIAILSAFVAYVLSSINKKSENALLIGEKEDELLIYLDFMKSQYAQQDKKLWQVVGSQIAEFLNQSIAPLTIVMVYKEADKTTKLLAKEVSSKAVKLKYSDDECGDSDSLTIEGTDSVFGAGYILKEKLSTVSKCKKLLIYNLENLRPSAAADLHSLLDSDNPNVKNAVYVFTVKVTVESDRSIYHTVSNLLKKQWEDELPDNILEPLLSRLVNFVKVEPEPGFDNS